MNFKAPSQRAKTTVAFALLAILFGCSGPSTFNSSAHPPTAVAHAVGLQPTSSAGADPLTITARSQSQVTLTGSASDGGAGAIGNFSWTQTDGAGTPKVVLLYLDSDTVTFTAPAVAQDTTLHFTLTVTTAGNAAATAHVVVLVKAVNDINAFLAAPDTPKVPLASQHHFSVAIGTLEGLGKLASPQEPALVSDAPVCVTLNPTINYVGRDGNTHTVNLPASQKQGSWSAQVGSAPPSSAPGAFGSYQNPRVSFDIPALNQDDLFVLFNNPVAGNDPATVTSHLNQQLVPSDIDKAFLSVAASVAAGSCDGTVSAAELTGKTLEILVMDESGNPVGTAAPTATFTPDDLVSQQTNAPYETHQTTAAYYDAIDPLRAKTTLSRWLDANCFVSTAPNFGVTPTTLSSAHATYTNNYDLGLGRDMYFTVCTAASPAVINGLAKIGDMASVVINYASLEAAASKLNPIIAVAMEYSAATDAATTGSTRSQRRFPKFYAFAPDDRDGSFKRVMTVNFDHRGEKTVPGTCTVCHGGTIPTPGVANFIHSSPTDYPTVPDPQVGAANGAQLGMGDIDTTFMPWDLDSFLYASAPQAANTDDSFVGLSVNPANYSRSAMEPSLKILNQLAYCTWQPEMETGAAGPVDRFAAAKALVSRWYGGAAGADSSYAADAACAQGSAPTASLLPNSTYNDSGPPPDNWTSQAPAGTNIASDIYHKAFARNCRACHTQNANLVDQFDGFTSFAASFQPPVTPTAPGTKGIQFAYLQGVMPLARLTMDRFWVDFSGGTSGASILATNLQLAFPTDPAIAALTSGTPPTVIPPGSPNIVVSTASTTGTLDTATTYTVQRFKGVVVDASKSSFVASYTWCLQVPGSSTCAAQPTGALTPTPSFDTSIPGAYVLQLSADNGLGVVKTAAFHFAVADLVPTYVGTSPCPAGLGTSFDLTNTAPPYSIDVSRCFSILGDETALPFSLTITDPPSSLWTAAVVPTVVPGAVPTINFVFTSAAAGDATIHYQLCDLDGECANGQTTVEQVANLKANAVLFRTYLQPAQPLSTPSGFTPTGTLSLTGLLQQDVITPPDVVVTLTASTPTTSVGASAAGILSKSSVDSNPANGQALTGFTYTPQAFSTPLIPYVTCDINGNSIVTLGAPCQPVTFTQTLSATGATPTSATVTIEVRALTSFSQGTNPPANTPIYDYLGSVCSTCHGGTDAVATGQWKYTANVQATYGQLRRWAGALPQSPSANPPPLTPITVPTDAAVYSNPCAGTNGHDNLLVLDPNNAAMCAVILQWVREGANFN